MKDLAPLNELVPVSPLKAPVQACPKQTLMKLVKATKKHCVSLQLGRQPNCKCTIQWVWVLGGRVEGI